MIKSFVKTVTFFGNRGFYKFLVFLFLFCNCSVHAQEQDDHVLVPKTVLLDSCPKPTVTSVSNGQKIPITPIEKSTGIIYKGDFTNFNTEDGLALTSVSCGFLDKRGNLWFGTYGGGVSCYNGKSFTNYSTIQGLANKTVLSIMEDTAGNLWFGTERGLTIYDGKCFKSLSQFVKKRVSCIVKGAAGTLWLTVDDKVLCYTPSTSGLPGEGNFKTLALPQKYKNQKIVEVLYDHKGTIWLATEKSGILHYKGPSPEIDTSAFILYSSEKGLTDGTIESMTEDNNGNIWVGTHTGAYRFNGETFRCYSVKDGLADNVVVTIKQDKTGRLWFGTNNGVSYCSPEQLSLPTIKFISYTTEQGLAHNNVFNITEDNSGNLWFGTFGGGLSRYNGGGFTSYRINKNSIKSNVRSILEDSKGNLWFGSQYGIIAFYDGKAVTAFDVPDRATNTFVLATFEDKRGNIWFGTSNKGILCYRGKSAPDKISVFSQYTQEQHGIASNLIRCITEDSKGNLWFGSFGNGVTCFTPDESLPGKGVFTNYTRLQGLINNWIWSITEDKNGVLWFTTKEGISSFDGKAFKSYPLEGLGISSVVCIAEDKNGTIWFGSNEGIVGINNKESEDAETHFVYYNTNHGLGDNVVYDLVIAPFPSPFSQDTINALIVGTNAGFSALIGWKDKNGKFIPFESSSVNIEKFKHYNPVWKIYNNKTGYPLKDLNTNSMCVSKVGFAMGSQTGKNNRNVIWGGCGDDKIICFDPFQINKNLNPPLLSILSVKVNEEKISWYNLYQDKNIEKSSDSLAAVNEEIVLFGKLLSDTIRASMRQKFANVEFSGVSKWFPLPENLVLSYERNSISFDFVASETGKNFLVRYQYILEGYDKDWSPVSDKTSATFGNMHEGTYAFKVKACSPDGIWCEPVVYTFKVLPPWYRTWWMYATYGVFLIVSVILIVRLNGRRLLAQKTELEQKVKVATQQIRQEKEKVEQAHELITEQKKVVDEKNKDILDSIHYAKRIQDALLKAEEQVSKYLPEHFVLFMPKDIVSGDFYWSVEKQDYWYVAAVDCTGHGVPGAFMSMLGMSFLNDIVADGQDLSPAEILDQLRTKIITELRQTGESGGNKDGMDISIIRLGLKTNELQWAGANNSILLINNNQLTEIKPDKQPIGYYPGARPFTNHTIPFGQGATLYIFSDGYTDQFGGPDGKKFKIKQLKELLLTHNTLPMEKQKELLKTAFTDWKGMLEQIDDVCVIGIRI